MKKVLVIAAHPDDEVLGCGGSIAKHSAAGDEVRILILAQGLYSRDDMPVDSSQELEKLRQCSRKASEIMGAKSVEFCDFPDNQMDSVPLLKVVKAVEAHLLSFKPEIVYTHHVGDVNIDHAVTHRAVVTAARPISVPSVRSILFFEVLSSTEWQVGPQHAFVPNWYSDIDSFLKTKLNALAAYNTEVRTWPHSRSGQGTESLARFRGCSAGLRAAEAFICGRRIE